MTTANQPTIQAGGQAGVDPYRNDDQDHAQAQAHAQAHAQARSIVVISAGMNDTSSSRLLADRVAQKTIDRLRTQGIPATISVIELRPLAADIANAIVSGFPGPKIQNAIERLAAADAVIASAPVYKAGISGLFKSFIDILDNDLLIAKPVVLAATAGSARHALVVDDQLRPLFAFMRALAAPTSLFAAPEDWADGALNGRIDRAATELAAMVASGIGAAIAGRAWDRYQHPFAGNASAAKGISAATSIDVDTDLMRLATGGALTAGR